MAWTVPRTWTAGMVVGATGLNTDLRDNMNFLLNGKGVARYVLTGNYSLTTMSAWTTLVSVTGTNTTQRAVVFMHGYFKSYGAANAAYYRLAINGTGGGTPGGGDIGWGVAGQWDTLVHHVTGLPTGVYTAAVQALVYSNCTAQLGTGASVGALPTTFLLMEV